MDTLDREKTNATNATNATLVKFRANGARYLRGSRHWGVDSKDPTYIPSMLKQLDSYFVRQEFAPGALPSTFLDLALTTALTLPFPCLSSTLLGLAFSLPFPCLSLTWHCLFPAFPRPSTTLLKNQRFQCSGLV